MKSKQAVKQILKKPQTNNNKGNPPKNKPNPKTKSRVEERQKTLNSNERTLKFFLFSRKLCQQLRSRGWKQQVHNWNLTSVGALYQEGFVPFLFCGPPGMKSHSNTVFLMQNLCWEEFGPRVWSASLFVPCVDRLPCALRLFSPISSPSAEEFFFFYDFSMWNPCVHQNGYCARKVKKIGGKFVERRYFSFLCSINIFSAVKLLCPYFCIPSDLLLTW